MQQLIPMTTTSVFDLEPLVSVAIATYNGSAYIRQQLDSIFNQSYKNIEVVVCDDCSKDDTAQILEEYAQKYGLRYVVNERNLGLIKNFEKSISMCRGQYIALSDQDDLWKENKLETLLKNIGDYTLVYSPTTEVIDENGDDVENIANFTLVDWGRNKSDLIKAFGTGKPFKALTVCNWVVSHQVMFNRDLVELALPIPASFPFHDAWLALCACKLNGIRYTEYSLMKYRLHSKSYTFSSGNNSSTSSFREWESKFNEKKAIRKRENLAMIEILNDISTVKSLSQDERAFLNSYHSACLKAKSSLLNIDLFMFGLKYISLFCWHRPKLINQAGFLLGTLLL
jgi:glycosyltransferase involved in cell wall biosynthesis